MVSLLGEPAEVGGRIGEILAPHVQTRVNTYLNKQKEKSGRAKEAGKRFLELLEREAPLWIEEYQALAAASGVDFDLIVEINCAVTLTTRASCTSVLVSGSSAPQGYPMLLKVRDEWPNHQCMGYRRVEGSHGMLFGTDACNMGVGQGCNEHGLAVANNSGGLVPEPAPLSGSGLGDCHVTRLILERAKDTDEALEVFRELQARGSVGLVDGVRGMIFLIADRRGKGLVLEADRVQSETLDIIDGYVVWSNHWLLPGSAAFTKTVDPENPLVKSSLKRYERGMEILRDRSPVKKEDLEFFSRDETDPPYSICNGTDNFPWRTVSAFIYEMDPAGTIPVRVAPGLPSKVEYKDVPAWSNDTPLEYMLHWEG